MPNVLEHIMPIMLEHTIHVILEHMVPIVLEHIISVMLELSRFLGARAFANFVIFFSLFSLASSSKQAAAEHTLHNGLH
jgi:hypothetical protein